MKYMFLLNRTTDALPEPGTAELDQIMQAYGRHGEAIDVYTSALELEPAPASRSFIARRIRELSR